MTPAMLAAQCFVFFVAGFESSTSIISNCLYELALNQDIQQRVRDEIDLVTKRYEGIVTYQSFQEMPYLQQVISGKTSGFSLLHCNLFANPTQHIFLWNGSTVVQLFIFYYLKHNIKKL